MPGAYTELYYHFVWATKERAPLITPTLEAELHGYIRGKCLELKVHVHALNGMEDHIHLACALPPTLSVAGFLHDIKGASSHCANQILAPAAASGSPVTAPSPSRGGTCPASWRTFSTRSSITGTAPSPQRWSAWTRRSAGPRQGAGRRCPARECNSLSIR